MHLRFYGILKSGRSLADGGSVQLLCLHCLGKPVFNTPGQARLVQVNGVKTAPESFRAVSGKPGVFAVGTAPDSGEGNILLNTVDFSVCKRRPYDPGNVSRVAAVIDSLLHV